MNSIPCDIVLLPTDEIADKAYFLSKQLEKNNTYYTLKDGAYYPHISLYMTQLKLSDMSHVNDLLSSIAARTPIVELEAKEYHQVVGYIDVEYHRNTLIDDLQMKVIKEINPIRDGLRAKDQARLKTAEDKERGNLQLYGYRSIGELFAPHLTFTRFKDANSIDTSALPDVSGFSSSFAKLGIFEMGDHGTCVRKIAEFNLGK